MLTVRAARLDDLDQLVHLSAQTGSGMTTMPNDPNSWVAKLEKTVNDFTKKIDEPHGEIYFLVMEDTDTQEIVGSSAVYAGVGLDRPFYSYKLSTITTSSQKLDMTIYTRVLHLVNDYTSATELGSLFLLPKYRRDGNGKFLSRCRFLLIADFRKRFSEQIFAELRGWLDDNEESPFWEHLGKKFFGLSYQKADFISAVDGSQFISDLMPKYPVYVDLLPEAAREVIGKPNKEAVPALKMLEKEGMQYFGYIDIFDAGPCVQCHRDQLKTVKESKAANAVNILDDNGLSDEPLYMISNSQLENYRMVVQPLKKVAENQVAINQHTANNLNIQKGDTLRFIPFT